MTDAASSALVFEATATAYYDGTPSLGSYYQWVADASARGSDRGDRALTYWRARASAPGIGRLYQPVRTPGACFGTATRVPLERDTLDALRSRLDSDFALISEELAWSTLLVTATAAYVHRVAGVARFSVGLPVHNRSDPAARDLIGPVMEVFPVDVSVEADDTYRSLHKRVGRAVMKTLRHAVPGTAPQPDYEVVVNVIPNVTLGTFGSFETDTRWIHAGAADAGHLLRVQLSAYGPDGLGLALDVNHAAAERWPSATRGNPFRIDPRIDGR